MHNFSYMLDELKGRVSGTQPQSVNYVCIHIWMVLPLCMYYTICMYVCMPGGGHSI